MIPNIQPAFMLINLLAFTLISFLPGLLCTYVLFAPGTLGVIKRMAFAVALSVILTIFITVSLLLSGFILSPGSYTTVLCTLFFVFVGISMFRWKISLDGLMQRAHARLRDLFSQDQALTFIFFLCVLGAFILGVQPDPQAPRLTEFFLEGSPITLTSTVEGAKQIRVRFNVRNWEDHTTQYKVVTFLDGTYITTQTQVIENGTSWHSFVDINAQTSGIPHAIDLFLYKSSALRPAAQLRYWVP